MVFTSTYFTSTRRSDPPYTHHIKGIQDIKTTNQVGTNTFQEYHHHYYTIWLQGLQGIQHHHVQVLHIIKNISKGSTIYLHRHKSTNAPKEGYKDLTISLQHLMGFISMITRLQHANDHIASRGHQTTICVGSIPKYSHARESRSNLVDSMTPQELNNLKTIQCKKWAPTSTHQESYTHEPHHPFNKQ